MSNGSINLRDPRLVVTVAVLLVAIAAINVRTFMPKRGGPRPVDDWQEDEFVLPEDTAELARTAAAHVGAAGDVRAASSVAASDGLLIAGMRDPFRKGSAVASSPLPVADKRTASAPSISAGSGLSCTAVLLGGREPVALIDDKACHPGDEIAGHEVVSIGPEGVWLRGPRGDVLLPAGTESTGVVNYPLVTDPRRQSQDSRKCPDEEEDRS